MRAVWSREQRQDVKVRFWLDLAKLHGENCHIAKSQRVPLTVNKKDAVSIGEIPPADSFHNAEEMG